MKESTNTVLAIDVAKAELVVFDGRSTTTVPNDRRSIRTLLKAHRERLLVCEPTSTHHRELVHEAHKLGMGVCLVNPRDAGCYRESRSFRAKTDVVDAVALHSFTVKHCDELRRWSPPSEELVRLRTLITARKTAVTHRASLTQAMGRMDEFRPVREELNRLVASLDAQIETIVRPYEEYSILRSIPGIGPVSATTTACAMRTCTFESADALVAYAGLDLRVRDSGSFKGRRRLTKRGDPVLRWCLVMAGFSFLQSGIGKPIDDDLKAKGRHRVERGVIAARKLLRLAHHLCERREHFDPQKFRWRVDTNT
ncbi:MAG: transposase [Fimbriimonadaceae bacterium]|nr:transposase [Fimbriimonadaceae bacterium]